MGKFIKTTKVQAFLRTLSKTAKAVSKTISIPAGAAGTVKNFYIPTSPITNSNGTDIGGFGDSSLVFATGVFDVEVANNKKDADLANGEYWIDYLTGEGRGKKKTTGTSEAVTYKHFVLANPENESPTNKISIAAESVSFSAGAAGTTGVVAVDKAPIYNADGGKIGKKGDTSFAWVTGTILLAEVDYNDSLTDTAMLASLATNGDYAIDYALGRIFYRKATTGTSDTCNYATRQLNVEVTSAGVGEDVNVIKVGGTAITLGQKASAASLPVVLPSDAAAAGSSSTLIADLVSPADGTVAYTSNVTVTCAGFPVTVDSANCTVVYIMYKPTGGTWQTPLVNGAGGVSLSAAANVITVAGAATPFAAGDTYVVGIQYQKKGYDPTTGAIIVSENSPINQQAPEDSLVDTTNVAAATNYYPSADGMQMLGSKGLSITGKFIDADGTMTFDLEVTNDEDATAANRDWISAGLASINTKTGIQTLAAALTVTNGTLTMGLRWTDLNFKYVRAVMTNDGATNAAILKARRVY